MHRLTRLAAATLLLVTGASASAEEEHLSLVPWKVLEPGTTVEAPLVLYWIPATPDEVRRSPLLSSPDLTLFASHCVAMRIVRLDDRQLLVRMQVTPGVPLAVLMDGSREAGRVEAADGRLQLSEVEELVRDELDRRAAEADVLLDRARELVDDGETAAAFALYSEVWEQRCVCPRQGRAARRALRKLTAK